MKKIIFTLLLVVLLFNGCTRDDICPENTATTPQLIIVFKDQENPNFRKVVENLKVVTDYDNSVLVLPSTATDSISLPLSTTSDTTKYQFIKTRGDSILNIDKVKFIYSRKEMYVNRACGFRMEYEGLEPILQTDPDNWIKNIVILRDTVVDDKNAHLNFFH